MRRKQMRVQWTVIPSNGLAMGEPEKTSVRWTFAPANGQTTEGLPQSSKRSRSAQRRKGYKPGTWVTLSVDNGTPKEVCHALERDDTHARTWPVYREL